MRITLSTLQKMAQDGIKIAMLTCYDASFAAVLEEGGVDTMLVGDSLGNVLQGHESTLPVTLRDAAAVMAAGAHMVKIEGGRPMLETVEFLTDRGIPVCGHLGLTPQSVHQLGGYKVQGKGETAAQQLLREAKQLEQVGAGMLVLEAIPAPLAAEVTQALKIPTIGIGAGVDCSGQ